MSFRAQVKRQKINKMKYKTAYNLIYKYLKTAQNSKIQINEYVPNSHISETFRDVLIYLELEDMFPKEFHIEHIEKNEYYTTKTGSVVTYDKAKGEYHILSKIPEYFNSKLLKLNGNDEIHKVYQKLSMRKDYLRNIMKIINIHLDYHVTLIKSYRLLDSYKIRIK
jgi:hypothetical protein